ncbi:MAG: hypothetical protein VKJ46_00375 [Leptolyngbyaceae bacterium]|nr:hypothetical protein [Leptolyngbyaceae bacterium]
MLDLRPGKVRSLVANRESYQAKPPSLVCIPDNSQEMPDDYGVMGHWDYDTGTEESTQETHLPDTLPSSPLKIPSSTLESEPTQQTSVKPEWLTLRELCEKHQVNYSNLSRRVKESGLSRLEYLRRKTGIPYEQRGKVFYRP